MSISRALRPNRFVDRFKFPSRAYARILLIIATSLLMLQCWWPETFTATLDINIDRTYTFRYEGVLAFAPAVAEIKKSGKLEPRVERKLKEAETKLAQEGGFKKFTYVGDGRYQVSYEKSGIVDRQVKLFGDDIEIVTLTPTTEGIEISGLSVNDNARQQLNEIGLGLDGTVRVLSGLKVVQHNAQKSPSFGGLVGSYEWRLRLDSAAQPPRVTLSNEATSKPVMAASTAGGLGVFAVLLILVTAVISRRKSDGSNA
jgi:hypothetical protein